MPLAQLENSNVPTRPFLIARGQFIEDLFGDGLVIQVSDELALGMNPIAAIDETAFSFGDQLFGISAYGTCLGFSSHNPFVDVEISNQIAEKGFALG
jgi:hypothetical protein